ncbi:MAG: hypothetical protein WCP92_06870 [bacterium]
MYIGAGGIIIVPVVVHVFTVPVFMIPVFTVPVFIVPVVQTTEITNPLMTG